MANNGDSKLIIKIGKDSVHGIGSFHKTLPHNEFGEVNADAFAKLVAATSGPPADFGAVPQGCNSPSPCAPFVNPRAGLAADHLVRHPSTYDFPPAPGVLSNSTAAEMAELYWMAVFRDVSFDKIAGHALTPVAVEELNRLFAAATIDTNKVDPGHLEPGVDLPGHSRKLLPFTADSIFRLGLPGDDLGPYMSQFFLRKVRYGTQTIDQRENPYTQADYLTTFDSWLSAQNSGLDFAGRPYPNANETEVDAKTLRYISTMRDMARFVHKDALHQAYFNAALLLLSHGARWTPGNPYREDAMPPGRFAPREAAFGTMGGPHILALVSEVATRALKVIWNQKWQVHLRLRPEVYGGLAEMEFVGLGKQKRAYGLPKVVQSLKAVGEIMKMQCATEKHYLLPMAFTSGSPVHPAYGAGHATVAGACVTVLKAFFDTIDSNGDPILLSTLNDFDVHKPGLPGGSIELPLASHPNLTIEGELNKLAGNVAMGRSMGGVHWRSDNTRSLMLGEALAAQVLADITTDLTESPVFRFRTFKRGKSGAPSLVVVRQGRIEVDGVLAPPAPSQL